jgi:ABC-type transport system substrate-binding protein
MSIKGLGYNAPGQERKMEIVQAQLADVGIDMTFDMMEVGSATSTFFEDLTYDLYCAGWSGRPDPSQTANSMFSSKSFYNAGKYASPGMDDALAAAGASQDQAERAAGFSKIIKLSQDDAIVAPLLHNPNINALHSNVGGFVPNLYGKIDVSFLWVEE